MIKIMMIVLALLLITACGGGDSSTQTKETISGNNVWITQDTWDRDNYSILEVAKKLEEKGTINVIGTTSVMGGDCEGDYFTAIYGNPNKISTIHTSIKPKRSAPTCSRYANIFGNIEHHQYPDVTTAFLNKASKVADKSITYVAGGGYTALANLLNDPKTKSLLEAKTKRILLVGSFDGNGDANENAAGGGATKFVFNHKPKGVPIVMVWGNGFGNFDVARVSNHLLKKVVKNGVYANGKTFTAGDTELLNLVVQNDLESKIIETCFSVSSNGTLKDTAGACGEYKLFNAGSDFRNWFESLIYK